MFHVYVDGVTGTTRDAVRRLSDAMAMRYGLPAEEVYVRLAKGPFRVKANVDQATADAYARDLESIGARVRIEQASEAAAASPSGLYERHRPVTPSPGARSGARSSQLPRPSVASRPPPRPSNPGRPSSALTSPPPAGRSSLPPQPASRRSSPSLPSSPASRQSSPSLSPLPAAPASPASRQSSPLLPQPPARPARSSLPQSAARPARSSLPPQRPETFEPTVDDIVPDSDAEQRLGALERSGLLSLTSLDHGLPAEPTAPLRDGMPASIGPAAPAASPRPARPTNVPVDLFAPPEAVAHEAIVELADDERDRRERKRLSAPPGPAPAPAPPQRQSGPSIPPPQPRPGPSIPPPQPRPGPSIPPSASRKLAPLPRIPPPPPVRPTSAQIVGRRLFGAPRVRFAAGVLLAIVLGFVPAGLIAALRERDAFAEIDARVMTAQARADTPQSYGALDAFRADQLDAKHTARRNIVVTSLLIWAVASSALAYIWFRRVPWDRLT